MKKPAFIHGVAVAAILAFVASAIVAALTPFVAFGSVVRLVIPLLSLVYVLYLLKSSKERTGNITTLSLWSALAVLAWWVSPPLPFYLLFHVAAIWLVRSLYFYSGVLPALADFGLCALSVSAFVWAVSRTGSVFLATWTFFLVQALFVAIPVAVKRSVCDDRVVNDQPFERARRQAEAALQQLLKQ